MVVGKPSESRNAKPDLQNPLSSVLAETNPVIYGVMVETGISMAPTWSVVRS